MKKEKNKLQLRDTLARNKYSFLAFAASAFVMLIVYYCFEVIPFGDYTVLRMDLYHQYGPLFAELYDRIAEGKSLIYSWNTGLGGSFLGNFGNYLASPLAIVMLIVGHKNMPEAIAIMVLLKAAFASAFFSYYLRKSTDKNGFSVSAFGVLYSFCGFFIAYYWNVMWIDAMALLPLVILGIESIIKYGKFRLYLFSLAAVMLTNYYMAYIVCLFSVIYFFAFYIGRYKLSDKFTVSRFVYADGSKANVSKAMLQANGSIFRKIANSRLLNSGLRFAFASVMAAGIAAFMLLPLYHILQSCSATSGTFPAEFKTYFKIFDFLANHLVSVDPTIRSSGDDVLPNVYCGVITVMLVPLYLYSKSYSKREKISFIGILGILFISFNCNYLNYVWHGFHFPNDLPYRLSYVYSFILLVMAFKALIHIRDYSAKMLLTTGISALAFIIISEKVGSKNVTTDTVIISAVFIVFYVFVMILMRSGKYQASAVALLLFCGIVSEAAIGNTSHYKMQQQKQYYTEDYDAFRTLKDSLDEREDNRFYRMELTDLRARMDPSWYNYNGISIFSSMAYEKTSNLIHYLGVDGNVINSYTYNGFQTPVFNMMTSLKYIVNNASSSPKPNDDLYTFVSSSDKFKAYRNNYNLSIGYCANKDILNWNYNDSNPFTVQNDYFESATGIKDLFTQIDIKYFDYDNITEIPMGYDTGNLTFFREVDDTEASFTACYEIKESKNYYIYIDSDNIEDVLISYDNVSYNHNFSSEHLVDIGYVEKDTTVYVNVPINEGNSGYVDMYMCGMDMAKFSKGYSALKKGQLEVETFDDTYIKGTATADKDCVFYTSIPYDESWQITVDGKPVSVEEMQKCKIGDGLIGFNLKKGTHEIELKYEARGLSIGFCVSAATVLLLVLFFVLMRKQKYVGAVIKGYKSTATINTTVVEEPEINTDSGFSLASPEELTQPESGNEETIINAESVTEQTDAQDSNEETEE